MLTTPTSNSRLGQWFWLVQVQPVEQLGRGGALVRFQPRRRAQVDQRVRLFGARGHDAARAVVFEAAPDQHLVIGQQGRGQRIARKAAHALAVEGEFRRGAAVDQAAAFGKTRAHL